VISRVKCFRGVGNKNDDVNIHSTSSLDIIVDLGKIWPFGNRTQIIGGWGRNETGRNREVSLDQQFPNRGLWTPEDQWGQNYFHNPKTFAYVDIFTDAVKALVCKQLIPYLAWIMALVPNYASSHILFTTMHSQFKKKFHLSMSLIK